MPLVIRFVPQPAPVRRYVTLPATGQCVTLGAYVRAVKTAMANPTEVFKSGLTTWWPTSGAEIMRQFRDGIHQRINDAIPYNRRGIRK